MPGGPTSTTSAYANPIQSSANSKFTQTGTPTTTTNALSSPSPPMTDHDAGPSQPNVHLGPAARKLLADGQQVPLPTFQLEDILDKASLYDPVTGYPLPPAPNDDGTPSIDPPTKVDGVVDPDHVPRPENKFILFRRDILARIASLRLPKSQQSVLSAGISDQWKSAPGAVRDHYQHLSQLSKDVHQLRYPGYKYQPRSQAKIKEDKVKNRERHEEQRRRLRDEKRVKRVGEDLHDPTPPGKIPIPRKFSSTRSSGGGKYEPPRGGKRISKEYAPFRQVSGASSQGQQDRQTSFKYYPKSAFGPGAEGEPDPEESSSDSESESRSKSTSTAKGMTPQAPLPPTFEAHVPMYQPPPFLPVITSHEHSASASPAALTLPPLPQQTYATQPLWTSLEQGVTWSAAAPVLYHEQPQWVQTPVPPQQGYGSWKDSDQEVSLNVQAPLDALQISQPQPQTSTEGLEVSFADNPFAGVGDANAFWGEFVAASMARGGSYCSLRHLLVLMYLPLDIPQTTDPTIQGLSVQDYAHYTGSSGAGAVAADPVNFFQALGVDMSVRNNDWEELGKMVANDGWMHDAQQQQAEDFSFGRFVSFGSSTKDVEVEQGSVSHSPPTGGGWPAHGALYSHRNRPRHKRSSRLFSKSNTNRSSRRKRKPHHHRTSPQPVHPNSPSAAWRGTGNPNRARHPTYPCRASSSTTTKTTRATTPAGARPRRSPTPPRVHLCFWISTSPTRNPVVRPLSPSRRDREA